MIPPPGQENNADTHPTDILTPIFGGGGGDYTLLIALLYTVSAPTIHHYLITRLQCQCAHNCDNYSKWWSNFRALNGAPCALRCRVFLRPVTQVERESERGRPGPEPDTFSGGRLAHMSERAHVRVADTVCAWIQHSAL